MLVPSYPWRYIGIEFVGLLPESFSRTGGFGMIFMIIKPLTSRVHLAPTRQTYRAKDVAGLMFQCAYKLHGTVFSPRVVVSGTPVDGSGSPEIRRVSTTNTVFFSSERGPHVLTTLKLETFVTRHAMGKC